MEVLCVGGVTTINFGFGRIQVKTSIPFINSRIVNEVIINPSDYIDIYFDGIMRRHINAFAPAEDERQVVYWVKSFLKCSALHLSMRGLTESVTALLD